MLTRENIATIRKLKWPDDALQIESWWAKVVDAAECGEINERLLDAHRPLLDLFECPVHGRGCIPYAIEELGRLRLRATASGQQALPSTEGLLVLKPVPNDDGEWLTCIICGRGESERVQPPEWLVTMRAPDATLTKGLHEECWQRTKRYLSAKGGMPSADGGGRISDSEALLRDRVHWLEADLKTLVRLWANSDLVGQGHELNAAMDRLRSKFLYGAAPHAKETHE